MNSNEIRRIVRKAKTRKALEYQALRVFYLLERVKGIEPSYSAWEAENPKAAIP